MIGGVVIVLAKPLLGRRYFITITMLRLAISETQCITGVKTWKSKLFLLGKGKDRLRLHMFFILRAESVLALGSAWQPKVPAVPNRNWVRALSCARGLANRHFYMNGITFP